MGGCLGAITLALVGLVILVTLPSELGIVVSSALVLAGIVWGLVSLGNKKEAASLGEVGAHLNEDPSEGPRAHADREPESGDFVWVPPYVEGRPVQPWLFDGGVMEVAGEYYRRPSYDQLFLGDPDYFTYEGSEFLETAVLCRDAGNPYDPYAVSVWVRGQHVGYLNRGAAQKFDRIVERFEREGEQLQFPARVWASCSDGRFSARVTLRRPRADGWQPANEIPSEPTVVLPTGRIVQVTKEDQHMEILREWLKDDRTVLAASLHSIIEQRPRSTPTVVEVRLDGQRVGVLSNVSSRNVLPLVQAIEGRAATPVARAVMTGEYQKLDVVLHVATAADVDEDWFKGFETRTE